MPTAYCIIAIARHHRRGEVRERDDKGVRSGRNKGTKALTENKGGMKGYQSTLSTVHGPRSIIHRLSSIVHPQLVQSRHTTCTRASTPSPSPSPCACLTSYSVHSCVLEGPFQSLLALFSFSFRFFLFADGQSDKGTKNKMIARAPQRQVWVLAIRKSTLSRGVNPRTNQTERQRKRKSEKYNEFSTAQSQKCRSRTIIPFSHLFCHSR